MPEDEIPKQEIPDQEVPRFDPSAYDTLGKKDTLATIRWYLIATGIIALIFATLCLFLDRTGQRGFFTHKDFSLNPNWLGRMLLYFGILCYAAGRSITYWQRFSKRKG
jgi:hypothetical protein